MLEKLIYMLLLLLIKFKEILFLIFKVVIYPIKNISIFITIILYFFIYKNFEIVYKGKDMFLMTISLVSILIFITNYLNNQTVDIEKIENYYLGYNIKKFKFYNNFWMKKFKFFPIKLFFWIIIIIPIIIILGEQEYKYKSLNIIFLNIFRNIKYINSVWISLFIVISFYCIVLFIESVSLTTKSFFMSYLYKNDYIYEKNKIRLELKKSFQKNFNDLLKIEFVFKTYNENDVEYIVKHIINRANLVGNNNDEIIEFYNIVFKCERNRIYNLLEKIYLNSKYLEIKNSDFSIYNYLFKKTMNLINEYYIVKWMSLCKLDVLPSEILKIAVNDLNVLFEIDNKLFKNKNYKDIFYNINKNICILKIFEILEKKINKIEFLNRIDDLNLIINLFEILNEIDNKVDKSNYFSKIFETLYIKVVHYDKKNIIFFNLFYNKMKEKNLDEFIRKERNIVSKNIISENILPNEKLKYLLNFMSFKDIISILIFRLLYMFSKESINIEEFIIFKRAIITNERYLDDFKYEGFIDELYEDLLNLNNSFNISKNFIKWVWESLFEKFVEVKYLEFMDICKLEVNSNISFSSYIILRLILCEYENRYIYFEEFTENNKKEIKNKLYNIKDILNYEIVYNN